MKANNSANKPIVSIVVPCLNRAHYLVPTIESILKQDYEYIECIVVDGGSTDGTIDILKSYGKRITWISEPDDGHADAINKGWWMSKGDILAWLNADDLYVVPDAIRNAVNYLEKNPLVDVVYGDYACISKDDKIISEVTKPREWDLEYAVKYCDHIICQSASFMRRSILEKVGWLDPEFKNGKDHELWLRIGLAGTIQYVPSHFSYVRIDKGLSQHSDIGEAKVSCNKKFFSLPDLPPQFSSKKFQRRSMSNAYCIGATYIYLSEHKWKKAWPSLKKSLSIDPVNIPFQFKKIILATLRIHIRPYLPQTVIRLLRIISKTNVNYYR